MALAGCATTPEEPCCGWAGIDARALLGSEGVDCGTIGSHSLDPRMHQLRCARDARRRGAPYMIAFHDVSKRPLEVLDVAIFTAQGEKVLLQQRIEEGAAPSTYIGTCKRLSVESDGRIRREGCVERVAPAAG
jgi:hypothetical protein